MMGPQGYPLLGHHAHSSISIHVRLMSGKAVQVPDSMEDPLNVSGPTRPAVWHEGPDSTERILDGRTWGGPARGGDRESLCHTLQHIQVWGRLQRSPGDAEECYLTCICCSSGLWIRGVLG